MPFVKHEVRPLTQQDFQLWRTQVMGNLFEIHRETSGGYSMRRSIGGNSFIACRRCMAKF